MIETHVHFNSDSVRYDIPAVIERANSVGVTDFIVVGFDLASSKRAILVAEAHQKSNVWAVVGVHPHDAKSWNDSVGAELRELSKSPRVKAIGEIGLDYYRDLSPRDAQKTAFVAQLALARSLDLPIVIHCRDAYDDCLPILESEASGLIVILHCFAGTRANAEVAWKNGWYLGVDGPITYKKNDELRAIIRDTPESLLVLETDAPYLSPEPLRSQFPNEPSRLPLIRAAVAAARGETVEAVERFTVANSKRAFRLE
jgi:TatD DNase family protein